MVATLNAQMTPSKKRTVRFYETSVSPRRLDGYALALAFFCLCLVSIYSWVDTSERALEASENAKLLATMSEDVTRTQNELEAVLVKVNSGYIANKSDKQMNCLAQAIYYEARGESLTGQMAVAEVVLNRTASKRYPDSICAVVFQNQQWKNRCQFSFACDGKSDTPPESDVWTRAQSLASFMMSDHTVRLTDAATHYHATYVSPHWSSKLQKTVAIGRHVFYRRHNA